MSKFMECPICLNKSFLRSCNSCENKVCNSCIGWCDEKSCGNNYCKTCILKDHYICFGCLDVICSKCYPAEYIKKETKCRPMYRNGIPVRGMTREEIEIQMGWIKCKEGLHDLCHKCKDEEEHKHVKKCHSCDTESCRLRKCKSLFHNHYFCDDHFIEIKCEKCKRSYCKENCSIIKNCPCLDETQPE